MSAKPVTNTTKIHGDTMHYFLTHTLVPLAIFFLFHKLFMSKKPKPFAILHCLAVFFLMFLIIFPEQAKEVFFNKVHLSTYAFILVHNLILPLILFYVLFFRENKEYDELLKKDIWQHWTDEPIHKKEGL